MKTLALILFALVLAGCGRPDPQPISDEAWRQHQARDRAYSEKQAEAWRNPIVVPEPLREFQK